MLFPNEDKLVLFSPFDILFRGGGRFWPLMKISLFSYPMRHILQRVGRCDSYNEDMLMLVPHSTYCSDLLHDKTQQKHTKAMFFLVGERPGWTELVRCAVCAASKTLFPSSWNELVLSHSLQARRTLNNRSPDYLFDPKLHLAKYRPWSILETPSKFLLLGWCITDSLIYSIY